MSAATTSLAIGVMEPSVGWVSLIEGFGLPWRVVHGVGEPTPDDFAAIIVNRHLWREEIEALEAYVRAGGAVLDINRLLHRIRPWSSRTSWIGSLDQLDRFVAQPVPDVIDLHARTRRYEPDDSPVTITRLDKGYVAALGFDPGIIMLDTRNRSKRFRGIDERHPAEIVSRIDKGDLALFVESLLQHLYAARDLPYVRKRRFPGDAPSVAAFRIDTDRGTPEQIDRLAAISETSGLPFTWFVHTEGHPDHLDQFAHLPLGEVALHCARHRTFGDYDRNHANIAEARRQMKEAGLPEPVGFAAPNGFWNDGLAEAIDAHRFLYSSEFSFAFDGLPHYPPLPVTRRVNEQFYDALQVPIHPVSVGNLARVGYDEEEMIAYYRQAIDARHAREMPRIFYHHPTHERYDVVEAIVEASLADGAHPTTFTEYALWWKKRQDTTVEIDLVAVDDGSGSEDRAITIRSYERDPSVQLDVILPDGNRAILWADGVHPIAELQRTSGQKQRTKHEPATHRRWSPTVTRRAIRDTWTRTRN